MTAPTRLALAALLLITGTSTLLGQTKEEIIRVDLAYRAPGNGPAPNFSPKGTQVPLANLSETAALPPGAARPAKSGVMKVGPDEHAWIPVLATADVDHPNDLCRIFLDRNRNGNFTDDGPALAATPTLNDKTKAWWSSFNKVELSVPYGKSGGVEPYMVGFWIVRDGDVTPDILRYSVNSWRFGTTTVRGITALVAAMDGDNDAIFKDGDEWSVLRADAPDAAKAVLSIAEARNTSRFMFLQGPAKELVLRFRSFSPDGRSVTFAVVDLPVTKAEDRRPDDLVGPERPRPRATVPFTWGHNLDAALAQAKAGGRKVLIDFETTWCGPCKSMDEWVWTDAEVAALLNANYVGVKLDGDIEKALVKRFTVAGYPTMLVLDAAGTQGPRLLGYQSSKEILTALK
jgi:thiol-disulfide isomerase/thioredoxin